MQLADHALRSKLTAVRAELVETKSAFLKELDALRDELEETQQRLGEAERQSATKTEADDDSEDLPARLEKAEKEAAALRTSLEQANGEISELRIVREQESRRHEDELRVLKEQAAAAASLRDHLNRQNAEVVRSRDALRSQLDKAQQAPKESPDTAELHAALKRLEAEREAQRDRADQAEQSLSHRESELKKQRDLFTASERAHKGSHFLAQSESRSLATEKERRMAAEKRVEQLSLELETLAKDRLLPALSQDLSSLLANPLQVLLAENREVRGQRDLINEEREQLVARLLEWMSPGQYLEHAAEADYDITKDPLIQVKLEELRLENELSKMQAAEKEQGKETKATARPLDPKQTLVEQAYAGALSDRWWIKHKPHKRHRNVTWCRIGIFLDERSEGYLQKRAQRRIERLRQELQRKREPESALAEMPG